MAASEVGKKSDFLWVFCKILVFRRLERKPQLMIGAASGDALNEAVGVENQSCHDTKLFGMKV